ncbi:LysE family translocator [Amnibacterium flavum]|uniref:Lysine transporter LysE n=1 Tax=Amnibacterium flavum TaxID=2173173 RepID=A0A2V1HRI7_9MICO|nr:LysE family translocator [Amnibacterium flavum]PVZ93580.1 lysine transporter LysE [Amnibacterium flavum]
MIPATNLLAFVLASIILLVMPGPSVLFVIGRSIALGRKAGLLSVLGNTLGMLPLIGAVALGLGAIVTSSVIVFTTVKLVGAAYLVWLGVQAIRHRGASGAAIDVRTHPAWRLLLEGFTVGVSNPKTIAFFVAVLPQFVDYRAGALALQMLELGVVFAILALACDSVWALAAGTARAWFGSSPRRLSRLSATGGVMMIGLGGALALTGSKH